MWLTVLGYVIGSVPLGLLAARRWGGIDPRRVGSGNVGAANVYRSSGWRVGLTVMALDFAKGAGTVMLAQRLQAGEAIVVSAGVAAVLGHVFPVWLRGHGGKGVATACGVFAVLTPLATLSALAVFALTVGAWRIVAGGSILATLTLPPAAAFFGASHTVVLGTIAVAILVVARHWTNVQRMRRGTERRLTNE